ncbi:MAG: hypothetical protein H6828_05545 [Planctomycetes bacterium]|nr:hypothetical protein [Planctomycetota bacterium]
MTRRPAQLLWTLLAALAVWVGTWVDFRAHTAEHREQFAELGEALIEAASGGALHLFRGGRYDPEELAPALETQRASLRAERLALTTGAGEVLADVSAPAPRAARAFELTFEPPQPRGQGRRGPGPPGLVDAPTGPLTLRLDLATDALDARLASDLRRFLGLAGALTAALALFVVLLAARERGVALAGELGRAQEELRGLEFLRRLGAGLAHETRNPLGLVRGFAQQLADGAVEPARVAEVGRTLVDEVDRTVSRLDEFLLLSRPAELRRERFELRALLVELARLLAPDLKAADARAEVAEFELVVDADREQARRLFMNLLLNGAQALARGGTLRVTLHDAAGGHALRIEDDGPGVPPDLADTLFEPYVTRRAGGTGLGLAIARRIAVEHGWTLAHEPVAPHGAAFVVRIPTA